jgi:hypothetical protein
MIDSGIPKQLLTKRKNKKREEIIMDINELAILSTIQPGERIEYTPKWSRTTRVYSVKDVQGKPKIYTAHYDRKEYAEQKKRGENIEQIT